MRKSTKIDIGVSNAADKKINIGPKIRNYSKLLFLELKKDASNTYTFYGFFYRFGLQDD